MGSRRGTRGTDYSQWKPCAITPSMPRRVARIRAGSRDHQAEQPTKIAVLVTPKHIQPPFDPVHTIVCLRQRGVEPPLDPVHTIVRLRQPRVEPSLNPIHTIVCMRQAGIEPPLDSLKRCGSQVSKLLQHGDPGFHIARISAAADRFNGNIRHVHRSVVNGGQFDGAW